MAGTVSVPGIASGINTENIISQMVALENRSLAKLQNRVATQEAQKALVTSIKAQISDLRSSANAFSFGSLFSTLSSTSSNTEIVGISATSSAPKGTHKLKVLQLASAHRIGSTGVESDSATPIATSFNPSSFGTAGSNFTAGLYSLNSTATNDRALTQLSGSTYSYGSKVLIEGNYAGTTNSEIVVKVTSGSADAGGLKVKVSTNGGTTFGSEITIGASADYVLGDIASEMGTTGLKIKLSDLASGTLKKDDQFSFQVRAKASIDFKLGLTGERKRIEFDNTSTLKELAQQINADSTALGIRADILNDGSSTNPYRLVLTSLQDGKANEINILNNDAILKLSGNNVEDPTADTSTYTGSLGTSGSYNGKLGNSKLVFEVITAGTVGGAGAAKYRVSFDGGLTFDDNSGAGYALDTTNDLSAFSNDPGFDLTLTNDGSSFSVGDRISIDVFKPEIQAATDAQININGLNIVKSSNKINDIFSGLTLDLKSADPTKTVTLTIAEKAGDIQSALSKFVESYNATIGTIQAQFKFDPTKDQSAPLLMGDSTLRQVQVSMQRYVSSRVGILGGDTLSSLGDLGISSDAKTGLLSLDTSKLSSAISSDPTAVRQVLSRFGDTIKGSNVNYVSSSSKTKAGTYEVKVTQARTRATASGLSNAVATPAGGETLTIAVNTDTQGTGKVTSLQVNLTEGMTLNQQVKAIQDALDRKEVKASVAIESGKMIIRHTEYGDNYQVKVTSNISNGTGFTTALLNTDPNYSKQVATGTNLKGTINGITAKADGDLLVGDTGFGFEGLKVRVDNDFTGTAGTIRLNDGLGSSFTKLLDNFIGLDGSFNSKIKSYDNIIERITTQITNQQTRTTRLEERLRSQFARLEVTLGQLNSTSSSLTAQLKTLPGVVKNN
jgi:flagellar hook-associated protein 2